MTEITYHLAEIRKRVSAALRACGRPENSVTIVAVSKGQPARRIAEAYRAGQLHFGESYVQEALEKIDELAAVPIEWHFIGPVQSNKTRAIAERFQWVHSVDRLKIIERLDTQRPFHAPPLNVLIQVNAAGERQKAGAAPAEIHSLAAAVSAAPRLKLRGLMGMPPASSTAAESGACFSELRQLRAELAQLGYATDTLSMGMSGDYEIAIANGSTCVRIGTAIFGPRN